MAMELAERAEITELPVIPEGVRQLRPLMGREEAQSLWSLATALAKSEVFKDAKAEKIAYAKILIGRDLGLSPTQSLMSLDIVEGNIFMKGILLAAFVRNSPMYHYKVLERTTDQCRLYFLGYPQDEAEEGFVKSAGRYWEVLAEESFTMEDARRAKLVKEKGGWDKYPQNMLFWRCISSGVKIHAPDLLGGMPVYTEADEITPSRPALVDGGEASAGDAPISTEAIWDRVREMVDPETYERLAEIVKDWPAARIEMTLAGRNAEQLKALSLQLEAQAQAEAEAAEAAREPVVDGEATLEELPPEPPIEEDEDAEPAEPPMREKLDDQEAPGEPDDATLARLEVLRTREDHVREQLEDPDVTEDQRAELQAELEFVLEEVTRLGGSTERPGLF